jgi:hypothetical protein
MTELKTTPFSVTLAFAKLAGLSLLVSIVGNFGLRIDYTLAIPFLLFAVFVWFGFVPRQFRYGTEGFEFTSRFSGNHFIPADRLRHWGEGRGVYLLEFDRQVLKRRTLQIALWFYPDGAKNSFLAFLKENYSDRYSSVWWGIRG